MHAEEPFWGAKGAKNTPFMHFFVHLVLFFAVCVLAALEAVL
jgi:hypothetical protein